MNVAVDVKKGIANIIILGIALLLPAVKPDGNHSTQYELTLILDGTAAYCEKLKTKCLFAWTSKSDQNSNGFHL